MEKDKFAAGRAILAKELKKKDHSLINDAIYFYLFYGTMTNEKYNSLEREKAKSMIHILGMIAEQFTKHLEDELQNGIPEGFDLFHYCSENTSSILEANDTEWDDDIADLLLTAFAATFRMWYEKIQFEDILAFLEDRDHVELPDMTDSSITFAWAVENGIPCSDIRSLFAYQDEQEYGCEEEKGAYEVMGELCEIFDQLIPEMVNDGIPQTFLDEKRTTCRTLFMSAQLFYNMIPPYVNTDDYFTNDEKVERLYEGFINTMAGEKLKEELATESAEEAQYFCKVFCFAIYVAHLMHKRGKGFFSQSREELYNDATKKVAESYKRKNKT